MTRRNGNYVCNYRRARRRKSEIASPLNSVRPTAAASFKTPRPSLGAASLEQTKIYLCACCMWHFLPVALERKAMKKEGNLSRDDRCEGKKVRARGTPIFCSKATAGFVANCLLLRCQGLPYFQLPLTPLASCLPSRGTAVLPPTAPVTANICPQVP